jgi:uncharacterized protein (DUF58 family)
MITWRPAVLFGLAAIGVAAVRQPLWVAVLAAVVLVALLAAADLALAGAPSEVSLARAGDRQVWLGDTARVMLTLTNNGVRAVNGEVRDAWVPSAGASDPIHRIEIEPGESVEVTTELRPVRRGDRPAAGVTIRAYGPLRFAYRQQTLRQSKAATPAWTLRVLPRFDSRRFLADKVARLRIFDGSQATHGRGEGTEFDSLRDYVQGDDVRSIDWRATARRRDVMVRTWRPERDRHVFCVVDTGRTSAVRVGTTSTAPGDAGLDEPRLDAAIDAALLLGEVANRAGDKVSLIAVDTAVRAAVSGGTNRQLLPKLIAALAPLQPALVETDFALLAAEVLRRERKKALVVLFTALETGALGEGLLPVLTELTARHTVMVAAVTDPSLRELADRRGGADEVYVAASALRAISDRDRLAEALRRRNVMVIDSPVRRYASDVTDAYLRMKATGRL